MSIERMFSVFHVSGSGMSAQNKLMQATSSNIANADTLETESGGPYVPKTVEFRTAGTAGQFGRLVERAMERSGPRFKSRDRGWVPELKDRALRSGTGVLAETQEMQDNRVQRVYDPENPKADDSGYVEKPNVNVVKEMTNMMMASRSYEANISVMNAAKAMMKKALEI